MANPFLTVKRGKDGRLHVHGTNEPTKELEDALNDAVALMTEEEARALLFQAERDDLPEYDPNGDEP